MTKMTPSSILEQLINKAKNAGADTADALFMENRSLSVTQRLGKPESIERSEDQDLGLRVFVGKRNATASTTDMRPETLDELVERVVSMAKVAPEDRFARIAEKTEIAKRQPNIELFDPSEPSAERLIERASAAEEAALAVSGVTNSEGGEAAWSDTSIILATSNGFWGQYRRSGHSLSAVVLAGKDQNMERDYEYSSTVFESDLTDPKIIGKTAGQRAVRRLNPKKPGSASIPVSYTHLRAHET